MSASPHCRATDCFQEARRAFRQGRSGEAESLCRMALALDPRQYETLNLLGVLLAGQGRPREALDALSRAVRGRPDRTRWRVSLANVCLRLDRQAEAIEHLDAALRVDPAMPEAHAALNRVRQALAPQWHFPMVNDAGRNEAYRRAIEATVQPGDLVLDIGTGSGLLSLMAARAGAGHVYAVEAQPELADAARRIVRQHGLADRVTVLTGHSTSLRVGRELPRAADVMITETFDSGLLGEGILESLAHARAHLMRSGATTIPAGARILGQLVESEELHAEAAVDRAAGFDLSAINRFAPLYLERFIGRYRHRCLSREFELFRFDFMSSCPPDAGRSEVRVSVTRGGYCHAIARRFRLTLAEGIVLDSASDPKMAHWAHVVRALVPPVRLEQGSSVKVRAAHDGRFVSMTLRTDDGTVA